MVKTKRGCGNPARELKRTTEGKCPYCHINVKSLEHHVHDKHKGTKHAK